MAGSQRSGPVPRLAVLGEFSAGKSSIINLLLGRDVLPTAVLSSTRCPIFIFYASELRIEAISEMGGREPVSPESVKTLARGDISYLDIGIPNELLRYVELIDTPGFADPFQDPERTLHVIERADVCVWCTIANQAWRGSERRIWLNLPARFRSDGVLVVTHTDTLAHPDEHLQVRARLEREAGDLFRDIVLLAVPETKHALEADGRIADAELWRDSGGSALIAALRRAAINYHSARGGNVAFAESAGFVWTGFPQVDSVVSSALAPLTAAPAPETSDVPSASAAELRFLAMVMETVPDCVASAWIDLAERKVLQFRGPDASAAAETAVLGEAIAELFQGDSVQRIERLLKQAREADDDDERHYFQEIIIIADDCVGVFLRHQSRPNRSLAVVSGRAANLGMVLARTRGLLELAGPLI